MALTRLATRGDLSQLRWARWQSARSFDAHPLNAYAPSPSPEQPERRGGWKVRGEYGNPPRVPITPVA
jgi:hypothetical protein